MLAVIAALMAVSLASETWTVAAVQALHFALVLVALAMLRSTPRSRRIVAITLASFAITSAAVAIVGVLNEDELRAGAAFLILAMAVSVVMPWGALAQFCAVACAAVALAVATIVATSFRSSAQDLSMVVGGWLATIYIAHIIQTQLRAIETEQLANRAHEQALARSEARFRTMFETSAIGMARFGADRRILAANHALEHMLGYDEGGLTGVSMNDITHQDDLAIDAALLDELAAGRCEHYEADQRYLGRNNETVWGKLTVTSLRDPDGETAYVAMIDDFTERKHLEQELSAAKEAAEQAARSKGRFLAVMSHEIRTPLNAMLGFNDLLAGTELDEGQQHFVGVISKSGRHLSDVIDDVLDFSKIEDGSMQLENIVIDLPKLVTEVADLFAPKVAEKSIALRCDCDSDAPSMVRGDPKRIRQILTNLIGNAVKFTEIGGITVCLRHRAVDSAHTIAQIEVADTGLGMTPAQQQRLFQPFVQADSSTTRKYGGTGLGLAICKQLTETMGGTIAVASEPGEGSMFRVEIPLEIAEGEGEHQSRKLRSVRAHRETLNGLRVLVAEDDATNAMLIERLLLRLGCTCELVENGEQALEALARQAHPIVLMDMDMPIMDGIEATRRIRSQFRDEAQPYIIAITAHVMPGDREACLAAGMNDYRSKPLRLRELEEALSRAIDDPTIDKAAWRN